MLRHLVVDLLVLAFAVFAAWSDLAWARWVMGGYAAAMIALKIAALSSGIRFARPDDAPPEWANHLLYGATLGVLAFGGRDWVWVIVAWTILWGLMAYSARSVDRARKGV